MPFEKIDLILPHACERLEYRFDRASEEEIQEGIKREEQRYKQQLKEALGEDEYFTCIGMPKPE